jgi:hypothetical protein
MKHFAKHFGRDTKFDRVNFKMWGFALVGMFLFTLFAVISWFFGLQQVAFVFCCFAAAGLLGTLVGMVGGVIVMLATP